MHPHSTIAIVLSAATAINIAAIATSRAADPAWMVFNSSFHSGKLQVAQAVRFDSFAECAAALTRVEIRDGKGLIGKPYCTVKQPSWWREDAA